MPTRDPASKRNVKALEDRLWRLTSTHRSTHMHIQKGEKKKIREKRKKERKYRKEKGGREGGRKRLIDITIG